MMEIDKIKTIVELMDKHNLSEFKVEADDMHLCLKRETNINTVIQQAAPAANNNMGAYAYPPQTPAPSPVPEAGSVPAKEEDNTKRETINSPIVGTFYKSPSPDSPAFVKVGDKVDADTVVGIIEAMKVMNEIKAEKAGIIKEILIENAQSVEYGTPIFVLE